MNHKEDLREALAFLTSQPECETCRLCEENVGLVYLIGDEAQRIAKLQLPILTTSQRVNYLGRTTEGWCCSFNPGSNTCKIYEDRPICCRIYPLDLMRINNEVWWVIHSECPIAQRFQHERRMSVLASMTLAIEALFSNEQLGHLLKQDGSSQKIEAFLSDESRVTKLRRFGTKLAFFPFSE
jgi:Fe-S-cluster containining protein